MVVMDKKDGTLPYLGEDATGRTPASGFGEGGVQEPIAGPKDKLAKFLAKVDADLADIHSTRSGEKS